MTSTVVADPWKGYAPSRAAPWNVRRVVHLHRRAGFAATWNEVQRDVRDGPAASVERLLSGKARLDGQPEGAASLVTRLTNTAIENGDFTRLQAAWVYRMLLGADPLRERLALMWHDHFATSYLKVARVAVMHAQNEIFRRRAFGRFRDMLEAVMSDPALLLWLDAPANRRAHPNENLARELMELFTLGIGHYSEKDVKEAARALTGWSVTREGFTEMPLRHDDGEKTILGQRGRFGARELMAMLLEHPATSFRLATKLTRLFMGERVVDAEALGALASRLRKTGLDVGDAVRTILRSQLFFDARNIGTRVADPANHVVGFVRALELFDPLPSTLQLGQWMGRLGQDLFNPPNVGGWPGGRAWLSSRSLIARSNFALALVDGRAIGRQAKLDVRGLAKRHGVSGDLESLAEFYGGLLHVAPVAESTTKKVIDLAAKDADPPRRLLHSLLSLPESHLA